MKINILIYSILLGVLVLFDSTFSFSKEAKAKENTAAYAQPNASAPKGGMLNLRFSAEPPTLHPIMSQDVYAQLVQLQVMDTLLIQDNNTWDWKPRIAEKYEISKDNKVFTFHLRKNIVFSDGQPITAEDVKFSFDAIFDPKYKAAHAIPYFEGIQKVEVVDPLTVKVTAKDTYYQNFTTVATMWIMPKHIYGDVEKSVKLTKELFGSGPYVLEKFERGQRIILKRNEKWYGFSAAEWMGFYNFAKIQYRFIKEDNVAFEMVKKGDLDAMALTPEQYEQKAQGAPWGQTVFKNQVENSNPKSYGYVGFNFKKEIFKDKNVRLALAHMMNREEMNKKFRFGLSNLATGPTYVQSDYASRTQKPILFDPKKAQDLLKKSGWKDSDKDGVLDKIINGKKTDFRISLIHPSKDSEKYWTMFKEDLKKIGVELEIRLLEWNSFLKLVDDKNFELMAMAWSTTVDWDPKQVWHSSSATNGGSNFISYKNDKVDKLIDDARIEVNREKRIQKLRKVYEVVADDIPYIFMFNDKYDLYANTNSIIKPGSTMKFDIGKDLWWSAKP